jgi:hypothetical protein
MIWNLGARFFRVISDPNLFTPKFRFPYDRVSAIKTVLGSPLEAVRKEWLSLRQRIYVTKGEDCPSTLDDRMAIECPPSTEDLHELVRNMLQYDPGKECHCNNAFNNCRCRRSIIKRSDYREEPNVPLLSFRVKQGVNCLQLSSEV